MLHYQDQVIMTSLVKYLSLIFDEGQKVFKGRELSNSHAARLADNDSNDPAFFPGAVSKSESSSTDSFTMMSNKLSSKNVLNAVPLVPCSDFNTKDNKNFKLQNKEGRKKMTRNEESWKKNIRKNNKLNGKEYINTKNVVISKKSMKPPCHDKCHLKCNQWFTVEQRLKTGWPPNLEKSGNLARLKKSGECQAILIKTLKSQGILI